MVTFKISDGTKVDVKALDGESVLDVAKRAGVAIDAPCSGQGTCGKCRVKLASGSLSGERPQHISEADYKDGWRLACQHKPIDDVEIFVPADAQAFQSRIRITDFSGSREKAAFDTLRSDLKELSFVGDCGLERVEIELSEPSLDDALADRERSLNALGSVLNCEKITFSLYAMRSLSTALRKNNFKVSVIVQRNGDECTVIDVRSVSAPLNGLAIDIGTTTVSMLLVNLETGDPIAAASGGNAQIRYGADVINRIIESGKPGGLERLRVAIVEECLSPLIKRLCVSADISCEQIYRVTVAGNTTMAHLFLGVNAENLRLEPYVPAFFHCDEISGAGLPVNPGAKVLLAPAVGSYVGGDITAGVFASGIYRRETISLFIDLGTNGELVFGSSEFLMCCACSAGPAFEGGEISCGMRATNGAVEACTIDDKTYEPNLTIIGDSGTKAVGLCGSGLIDIIGELFRTGMINSRGKFVVEGKRIVDNDGAKGYVVAFAADSESGHDVVLSEVDIDNFIRAKGAIFSAIRTMLAIVDYPVDAIEEVYVAGGIGSGIDIKHAILIGMFPNIPVEKYKYIGNSSLSGAYSMLTSKGAASAVTDIGNSMTYLELSSHPSYMDEFVAACFLPHTDASLFS
jgi:uncharacterized 2Fe-2S/4Fe-4S cluster protein (DUF4445 family)